MTMSTTQKQHKLLGFIHSYIVEHNGIAPSYAEMLAFMGLKSKSGINRILNALVERGRIRRLGHRVRAIEVIGQDGAPLIDRASLELVIRQSAVEERAISLIIADALREYVARRQK